MFLYICWLCFCFSTNTQRKLLTERKKRGKLNKLQLLILIIPHPQTNTAIAHYKTYQHSTFSSSHHILWKLLVENMAQLQELTYPYKKVQIHQNTHLQPSKKGTLPALTTDDGDTVSSLYRYSSPLKLVVSSRNRSAIHRSNAEIATGEMTPACIILA